MSSKFYRIPGSHRPSSTVDESSSLLSESRDNETYFSYRATPIGQKISSRYDPNNPNKNKLGTYDGVFVPTALNVLSILMFLRFGFILGQLGIICTIALLLLSYLINLLTTLSISAISTNGTVRGGGAYYMISRCLGPEFGGSIGLVFFLGQVFNSGMNAIGIVEPILYNLGQNIKDEPPAALFALLPRGEIYVFIYATIILFICFGVAFVGSQTVSRAGNVLFIVLAISIISIPVSVIFKSPFHDGKILYSGPSWETFYGNLMPHFTKGAAGSLLKKKETFSNLFGVFFPATAGIFAGAGMSSELRKPSKSIPKGTLWGLIFTFICYTVVVLAMSCSIPRETLYSEVQVIQSVSGVQWIIFLGELSTSLFSIIVGMVGAAYVLEAISMDNILPGLSIFCRRPIYSLIFTWMLTQLCLLSDVNKIASFITLTFLMTFIVMNLACFLLEVAAAPNFRPSFKYFDRYTALSGAVLSTVAMIVVDGITASAIILSMGLLFLIIHYFCPPKPWGDVSQSLIYHQVRKYLLRLRQDNIKYWRPQVLLFVDNPRTSWTLIRFCNSLKKGGLYVLGHVTVTNDFQTQYSELKKQKHAWEKIRDMSKIKAFVQVATGPSLLWGIRNVYLGSGLGGMKPNISVIGFFDLESYRHHNAQREEPQLTATRDVTKQAVCVNIPMGALPLPTDMFKNEEKVRITQWVEVIEDLSLMQSNIAVAYGFGKLKLPEKGKTLSGKKQVIDLYPIQMSATMNTDPGKPSIITSNFDTYTLILQLGAILITVPEWRDTHELRIILFVENDYERISENERMVKLLQVLRIEATVLVVSLDQFRVYNTIVKGNSIAMEYVNEELKDNTWWKDLIEARETLQPKRRFSTTTPAQSQDQQFSTNINVKKTRKYSTSKMQKLGVSLKMESNMPKGVIQTPIMSDDSENETDSMRDSHLSIGEVAREMKHQHVKRLASSISQFQKRSSSQNLKPVFSSKALPNTKVIEDSTGDKPSIVPIEDEIETIKSPRESLSGRSILPEISPCCSDSSLVEAMENLGFGDLPSRAQYLVLNDMMIQLSRKSNLIFSTLPIPALGTHQDLEGSVGYVEDIDIWLRNLPPTMLINSQTMTVTTAL
ncbi:similar to Saccharomyces cerevisiae YBR235W Putative ion transporter, similar to mammalian electroneutral Na(+)-(K+)-C1- cotransporter family [Maudiozyma barnettii]|uniref:Similar to Saccharomyces cerevisiae YBR235W Putative ion transporter, similar to mammalian electroneutral Na(+)-(K+)-C1- cotransporter family n=1 Tax=Maudiozyma barnettii TaxID=61262 RepID=A0A8H2VJQ8_9SACH|nr:Vhc1p [Kazachstania barnettii]CAB4256692.1 similar to Saccharomyces cerevisiae YBR235W Putative ion transporter, similar to mammalian electroneutral Na(+)-(K+)-C1- cotransporter family [Kazachstania barnettii]CAD1785348.1 similar to Saccharomyces cerevisiae YBR235W Putative ion transporter, similar to mammalian electroneutral Na(+)-(K+)-C1- cotransporter family [Kazachstania barnettii]